MLCVPGFAPWRGCRSTQVTLAGMTHAIVLDKSFLQGSKKARIYQLAETHRLIVSDALFYELLTASEPGRSRCFAKFPPDRKSVV